MPPNSVPRPPKGMDKQMISAFSDAALAAQTQQIDCTTDHIAITNFVSDHNKLHIADNCFATAGLLCLDKADSALPGQVAAEWGCDERTAIANVATAHLKRTREFRPNPDHESPNEGARHLGRISSLYGKSARFSLG